MEYLVTMTTQVPGGTSEATVEDIRTREAARSRELAAQGHLLRLWRPPLQPGEWRTLGLFAADDGDQIQNVLASMPLRVWRTDEVTPLSPHPNDPAPAPGKPTSGKRAMEFLIALTIIVPEGTPGETVDDTKAREAERAHELAVQGHLLRLWTPPAEPDEWRTLGLWAAQDTAEMQAILESLPLYVWTTVEATPLSQHPNDPAIAKN
jgi:muconolactone delta-isomerase